MKPIVQCPERGNHFALASFGLGSFCQLPCNVLRSQIHPHPPFPIPRGEIVRLDSSPLDRWGYRCESSPIANPPILSPSPAKERWLHTGTELANSSQIAQIVNCAAGS